MVVGMITAVPWILAAITLIQDVEAVQDSFLPSLELFHQATGSKSAATFMQAYMTLLYYCTLASFFASCAANSVACIPSQWITSSRIAWAFSRDVSAVPLSTGPS